MAYTWLTSQARLAASLLTRQSQVITWTEVKQRFSEDMQLQELMLILSPMWML